MSSFDESVEVAEADLHPWYACFVTMADTKPIGRTNAVRGNANNLAEAALMLSAAIASLAGALIASNSITLVLASALRIARSCVAPYCIHAVELQ